jgi:hypothetical protein
MKPLFMEPPKRGMPRLSSKYPEMVKVVEDLITKWTRCEFETKVAIMPSLLSLTYQRITAAKPWNQIRRYAAEMLG